MDLVLGICLLIVYLIGQAGKLRPRPNPGPVSRAYVLPRPRTNNPTERMGGEKTQGIKRVTSRPLAPKKS